MFDRLAFVDLETSGLSPSRDRITEVGIVLFDDTTTTEWSTLVHPGREALERRQPRLGITATELGDAPRFSEIASELYGLLAGRLFIAHNARFDYAFLREALRQVDIDFVAPVVCSVMLSRRLYVEETAHDLDSVSLRYRLTTDVRHRALPDARLLWQFWQVLRREFDAEHIAHVIAGLLQGPVLPPDLDPAVIDRLPDAPGVFALKAEQGEILHAGHAQNLRRHLIDYFRIDHASRRAIDIAHRVRDVTWEETRGVIGAQLKRKTWSQCTTAFAWLFNPEHCPCMVLTPWRPSETEESYGRFETERRAKNALRRLADSAGACLKLLGLAGAAEPCATCAPSSQCAFEHAPTRAQHLTRLLKVLRPLRNPAWPYPGAIGIRERSDLHVVDTWAYLGTARNESEVYELLDARACDTSRALCDYLARTLPKLPPRRIVSLDTLTPPLP